MLLAFGANTYGQLGLLKKERVTLPTAVEWGDDPLMDLATGGRHTWLLDVKGRLYVTGDNKLGQCIHGESFTERFIGVEMSLLALKREWIRVVAGWEYSILFTRNEIGSCGYGAYGELGLGPLIRQTQWQWIPGFPPRHKTIRTVSAGLYHVICLLTDGACWGWGDARHGELGPGLTGRIYTPTRMNVPAPVRAIACGRGFSVTLSASSLDIWGRLRGIPQNIQPPANLDDIQSLAASWSAIFLLMQQGSVVTLGCNDLGQACPEAMPPLKMLSAGSEHCLGIGIDGKVYGWGWNEHSNIRKDNIDVREVYSIDLPKGKVGFVAAGCGTSWIYLETLIIGIRHPWVFILLPFRNHSFIVDNGFPSFRSSLY
ncbi:hypothetical protein PCK1_000881 [Pneumocystis canis]|nr:hypothetical protein PCK1_000881 [Pneumocystis canis]